ncbi:RNA-directed DNA polymerase, eukaryota [Tanacetum coccineum]
MVEDSWKNSVCMESNSIIKLKKKLQSLKSSIKHWLAEDNQKSNEHKRNIQNRLIILDKIFDQGSCNDDLIHERSNLLKELQDFNKSSSLDMAQKAKIRWAIEGDENSKFFHGIINKKRSQLAIHGVLADGDWIVEPSLVKNEFLKHFATRFAAPSSSSITFDYQFPNRLTPDQIEDLERNVSYEEIKRAVWDCGISKSPGPDGFTFEFYRKYWSLIDHDVVAAVTSFFSTGSFPPGCNSSFITLIPKSQEAKMVKDFRPISLIGSMYKIITKVLANRLSLVISELVSDVQSAFVSNRHILDGPFILNELLSWCKHKKSKALIFKIDFEKAFDSVRWDYLDVVLANFGFGLKWRSWIQGCLNSAMGSILVNGSPTSEFKFSKGLKQGDPLSPFLFILIMESLHLSFNNVVNAGLYNGIQIDESLNLSHLFYADDVIFVGKWNSSNLSTIVNVLKWFYLASGLKINLNKSKLMGIGISHDVVASAAKSIGCSILHTPFNYLGVKVGGIMSRLSSWDDVIAKLSARLSKWKLKSLSIGGRLTLIKSVLSSLPLYYMSSFKVPKGVLSKMESIRRNFFNGVENAEKKMSLIGWNKILASKKNGAIYGIRGALDNSSSYSRRCPWVDIVNEVRKLASKGNDLLSLVKKKVGNGEATSFWNDVWLGDFPLKQMYSRLYFLELDKHVSVVSKLRANSLISSFRRSPRSGIEEEQLLLLIFNTSSVILPNISDRWSWLLDPSGDFSVKSLREFIDDSILSKMDVPIRWVKSIPIKINIFAWRVSLDKMPTRLMEQGSVPLPITKEAFLRVKNGFTKEAVLRLNNGLVTFEQARALFNVDLSTFKARLVKLNIFVWNKVNGPVRIHGGDYLITIVIKEREKHYAVQATKPIEYVRSMVEADLRLSSGCYKLTYNLPPNGDVWVKTDRDWHFAVEFSKERGYLVYLDLETCPSVMIVIKERQKYNVVQATKPFETVKSMIEADLSLSPGCYKLTYNLPPNRDV